MIDERLGSFGDGSCCESGFEIFGNPKNVYVGKRVNLVDVFINAVGEVIIEDYVFFGHGVKLLTGTHDYTKRNHERQHAIKGGQIHIEEGAWVASGSIIIGPVRIGRHSVVAAGSIVKNDVAPGAMVAGNPARFVKLIEFSDLVRT